LEIDMQRDGNGRLQRLSCALALGAAAFACATQVAIAQGTSTAAPAAAAAAASTQPLTGEAAAIKKSLEERFPGAEVTHVGKTRR
jgi:hypothetical protein